MTGYPCPFCGTSADLASGCPGCGRGPDTEAAEVIRLDDEIIQGTLRLRRMQQEYADAAARLDDTRRRREVLVARVRARVASAAASGGSAAPSAAPAPAPQVPAPPLSVRLAEDRVSALAVQRILFVLGGLLLGSGAIVFTAVAWATFGVMGRAAILAVVTVLTLGAPLLATRRGLGATAETFAALGLLLVLLDGYAAWSVDLAGVAALPRSSYAAGVCAVTAAVAAGYAFATGLVAPRFTALVVAQPALPLAVIGWHPSAAGWAFVFALVAAANLLAVRVPALPAATWTTFGAALSASAAIALWSVASAERTDGAALAGAALLAAALVLLAGARRAGQPVFREVAGGLLVAAVLVAAGRVVELWSHDLWSRDLSLVLVTATVAVVSVGVAAGTRAGLIRVGPWTGAVACLGVVCAWITILAAAAAVRPDWYDWQLPVAVVLLAGALVALISAWEPARRARPHAVTCGVMLAVFALPAAWDPVWWQTATLDLATVAALAGAAVHTRMPGLVGLRAVAAAALAAHAAAVSSVDGAVLGAIVLVGVGTAAIAQRRSTPDKPTAVGLVGGVGLVVGVVVWPAAVASTLHGAGFAAWWIGRGTLVAAGVLPPAVAAVRRWWPEYAMFAAPAAAGVTAVASLWPYGGQESTAVYASAGAVLVAIVVTRSSRWLAPVVAVLGLRVVVGVGAALWGLLGGPYRWLGEVWSGAPARYSIVDAVPACVSLTLLAVAAGLFNRLLGLALAPLALLAGLASLPANWPATPLTSLLIGLAVAVVVALRRLPVPALLIAVPLAGAGLAGTLPEQGTTLAGLGLVLVAGSVAGAAGRTAERRICGWLAAVAAAGTFAVAAAFAAGVDRPGAAFWTLGAAAAALTLGGWLTRQQEAGAVPRAEAAAVDAAAHASAVAALLLTLGAAGHAAAVCTLWGLAIGVRAFWPGAIGAARPSRPLATAAAGCELLAWWLLLASNEVAVVEAYTIPTAGLALLAGGCARRVSAAVRSWTAYGPALAAAFLPSLATSLVEPGEPLRRLALGLGALAVLVIGAERRNQAAVVAASAVLAVVALHELALIWQELPTWAPLTAGGLLLVWLAVTYERRRRDLGRLRSAVNRMS